MDWPIAMKKRPFGGEVKTCNQIVAGMSVARWNGVDPGAHLDRCHYRGDVTAGHGDLGLVDPIKQPIVEEMGNIFALINNEFVAAKRVF